MTHRAGLGWSAGEGWRPPPAATQWGRSSRTRRLHEARTKRTCMPGSACTRSFTGCPEKSSAHTISLPHKLFICMQAQLMFQVLTQAILLAMPTMLQLLPLQHIGSQRWALQ